MNARLLSWTVLFLLWLAATLSGLLTRPLIPVDELRYAAVAWEMWARGDFLVPYLNGAPYSHKPPLFFWIIHAGWLAVRCQRVGGADGSAATGSAVAVRQRKPGAPPVAG